MNNVLRFAGTITKVISTIVGLIPVIEQLKQAGHILTSDAAREAVVDGALRALLAAEGLLGRDLLNDPEFRKIAGGIVDLIVAFHNLVGRAHRPSGA